MDDAVLELSERGHCAAEVEKAVACLKGEGISVGLQLMPGLPGDSGEKSVSSLMRVLDLQPDFLRIYPTVVVAGTPLSRRYAEGRYCPLTLEGAVSLCKILLHRALLARVPVVRIGLQPTTDLSRGGAILAGPYHPAFRQLVEAELCFDLLARLIPPNEDYSKPVSVSCSPSRIADVVGQRVKHSDYFVSAAFGRQSAGDCSLTPFEIRVESSCGTRRGNIVEDLNYV
jgi:histone acetyltransferase (RNA polymerase elongator complex component)